MIYEIDLETITNLVKHLIQKSKKLNGTLVLLNKTSDLADEIIITEISYFNTLNLKKNDFLEITIYDKNDDDIFYEEFLIGTEKDSYIVKTLFIHEKPTTDNIDTHSVNKNKSILQPQVHPFKKFIKK